MSGYTVSTTHEGIEYTFPANKLGEILPSDPILTENFDFIGNGECLAGKNAPSRSLDEEDESAIWNEQDESTISWHVEHLLHAKKNASTTLSSGSSVSSSSSSPSSSESRRNLAESRGGHGGGSSSFSNGPIASSGALSLSRTTDGRHLSSSSRLHVYRVSKKGVNHAECVRLTLLEPYATGFSFMKLRKLCSMYGWVFLNVKIPPWTALAENSLNDPAGLLYNVAVDYVQKHYGSVPDSSNTDPAWKCYRKKRFYDFRDVVGDEDAPPESAVPPGTLHLISHMKPTSNVFGIPYVGLRSCGVHDKPPSLAGDGGDPEEGRAGDSASVSAAGSSPQTTPLPPPESTLNPYLDPERPCWEGRMIAQGGKCTVRCKIGYYPWPKLTTCLETGQFEDANCYEEKQHKLKISTTTTSVLSDEGVPSQYVLDKSGNPDSWWYSYLDADFDTTLTTMDVFFARMRIRYRAELFEPVEDARTVSQFLSKITPSGTGTRVPSAKEISLARRRIGVYESNIVRDSIITALGLPSQAVQITGIEWVRGKHVVRRNLDSDAEGPSIELGSEKIGSTGQDPVEHPVAASKSASNDLKTLQRPSSKTSKTDKTAVKKRTRKHAAKHEASARRMGVKEIGPIGGKDTGDLVWHNSTAGQRTVTQADPSAQAYAFVTDYKLESWKSILEETKEFGVGQRFVETKKIKSELSMAVATTPSKSAKNKEKIHSASLDAGKRRERAFDPLGWFNSLFPRKRRKGLSKTQRRSNKPLQIKESDIPPIIPDVTPKKIVVASVKKKEGKKKVENAATAKAPKDPSDSVRSAQGRLDTKELNSLGEIERPKSREEEAFTVTAQATTNPPMEHVEGNSNTENFAATNAANKKSDERIGNSSAKRAEDKMDTTELDNAEEIKDFNDGLRDFGDELKDFGTEIMIGKAPFNSFTYLVNLGRGYSKSSSSSSFSHIHSAVKSSLSVGNGKSPNRLGYGNNGRPGQGSVSANGRNRKNTDIKMPSSINGSRNRSISRSRLREFTKHGANQTPLDEPQTPIVFVMESSKREKENREPKEEQIQHSYEKRAHRAIEQSIRFDGDERVEGMPDYNGNSVEQEYPADMKPTVATLIPEIDPSVIPQPSGLEVKPAIIPKPDGVANNIAEPIVTPKAESVPEPKGLRDVIDPPKPIVTLESDIAEKILTVRTDLPEATAVIRFAPPEPMVTLNANLHELATKKIRKRDPLSMVKKRMEALVEEKKRLETLTHEKKPEERRQEEADDQNNAGNYEVDTKDTSNDRKDDLGEDLNTTISSELSADDGDHDQSESSVKGDHSPSTSRWRVSPSSRADKPSSRDLVSTQPQHLKANSEKTPATVASSREESSSHAMVSSEGEVSPHTGTGETDENVLTDFLDEDEYTGEGEKRKLSIAGEYIEEDFYLEILPPGNLQHDWSRLRFFEMDLKTTLSAKLNLVARIILENVIDKRKAFSKKNCRRKRKLAGSMKSKYARKRKRHVAAKQLEDGMPPRAEHSQEKMPTAQWAGAMPSVIAENPSLSEEFYDALHRRHLPTEDEDDLEAPHTEITGKGRQHMKERQLEEEQCEEDLSLEDYYLMSSGTIPIEIYHSLKGDSLIVARTGLPHDSIYHSWLNTTQMLKGERVKDYSIDTKAEEEASSNGLNDANTELDFAITFPTPFSREKCLEKKSYNGYMGCQSQTMSGFQCQSWAKQWPHEHDFSPIYDTINDPENSNVNANNAALMNTLLRHNFCANPDGRVPGMAMKTLYASEATWCYVANQNRQISGSGGGNNQISDSDSTSDTSSGQTPAGTLLIGGINPRMEDEDSTTTPAPPIDDGPVIWDYCDLKYRSPPVRCHPDDLFFIMIGGRRFKSKLHSSIDFLPPSQRESTLLIRKKIVDLDRLAKLKKDEANGEPGEGGGTSSGGSESAASASTGESAAMSLSSPFITYTTSIGNYHTQHTISPDEYASLNALRACGTYDSDFSGSFEGTCVDLVSEIANNPNVGKPKRMSYEPIDPVNPTRPIYSRVFVEAHCEDLMFSRHLNHLPLNSGTNYWKSMRFELDPVDVGTNHTDNRHFLPKLYGTAIPKGTPPGQNFTDSYPRYGSVNDHSSGSYDFLYGQCREQCMKEGREKCAAFVIKRRQDGSDFTNPALPFHNCFIYPPEVAKYNLQDFPFGIDGSPNDVETWKIRHNYRTERWNYTAEVVFGEDRVDNVDDEDPFFEAMKYLFFAILFIIAAVGVYFGLKKFLLRNYRKRTAGANMNKDLDAANVVNSGKKGKKLNANQVMQGIFTMTRGKLPIKMQDEALIDPENRRTGLGPNANAVNANLNPEDAIHVPVPLGGKQLECELTLKKIAAKEEEFRREMGMGLGGKVLDWGDDMDAQGNPTGGKPPSRLPAPLPAPQAMTRGFNYTNNLLKKNYFSKVMPGFVGGNSNQMGGNNSNQVNNQLATRPGSELVASVASNSAGGVMSSNGREITYSAVNEISDNFNQELETNDLMAMYLKRTEQLSQQIPDDSKHMHFSKVRSLSQLHHGVGGDQHGHEGCGHDHRHGVGHGHEHSHGGIDMGHDYRAEGSTVNTLNDIMSGKAPQDVLASGARVMALRRGEFNPQHEQGAGGFYTGANSLIDLNGSGMNSNAGQMGMANSFANNSHSQGGMLENGMMQSHNPGMIMHSQQTGMNAIGMNTNTGTTIGIKGMVDNRPTLASKQRNMSQGNLLDTNLGGTKEIMDYVCHTGMLKNTGVSNAGLPQYMDSLPSSNPNQQSSQLLKETDQLRSGGNDPYRSSAILEQASNKKRSWNSDQSQSMSSIQNRSSNVRNIPAQPHDTMRTNDTMRTSNDTVRSPMRITNGIEGDYYPHGNTAGNNAVGANTKDTFYTNNHDESLYISEQGSQDGNQQLALRGFAGDQGGVRGSAFHGQSGREGNHRDHNHSQDENSESPSERMGTWSTTHVLARENMQKTGSSLGKPPLRNSNNAQWLKENASNSGITDSISAINPSMSHSIGGMNHSMSQSANESRGGGFRNESSVGSVSFSDIADERGVRKPPDMAKGSVRMAKGLAKYHTGNQEDDDSAGDHFIGRRQQGGPSNAAANVADPYSMRGSMKDAQSKSRSQIARDRMFGSSIV